MAVAMVEMDGIVILDDDEEEPSSSSSPQSAVRQPRSTVSGLQQSAPTHITQSPFASARKETHVLRQENEKLFAEFVEHCSTHTQDCPEVMTFLHTKYSKASPEFLCSVEFRNTLGRCLTRAQAKSSKTFVYINELCTVLKQHAAKRRHNLSTVTSEKEVKKEKSEKEGGAEERNVAPEAPSTSVQQQGEEEEEKKKTKKASRRQVAYLENLLKVYNEEIRRLQERELSLSELEQEDSSYIQEHKLKRKMMKIYDKLCELKGCSTLTGRVIEQRIYYNGTRYPEINKKIERFINSPEARQNPPDYSDILGIVQRVNERHSLSLSRKQLTQIAQDAFRETGNRLQERRHLDMVYNFGCHLTDSYKPTADPALCDGTLARRLRSNREVALSSLDAVITKYSNKQDDTEEEERRKRLEKDRQKKEEAQTTQQDTVKMGDEQAEQKSEEEEEQGEEDAEEDEEDEVSSDPDIEEEIEASQAQVGPDDEEEEDNAEQLNNSDNEEQENEEPPSIKSSVQDEDEEEEEEEEEEGGDEDHQSESSECKGVTKETSPVDDVTLLNPSSSDSPGQSVAGSSVLNDNDMAVPRNTSECAEVVACNESSSPSPPVLVSTNQDSLSALCSTRSANCSPLLSSSEMNYTRQSSRKRKREAEESQSAVYNGNHVHDSGSDSDIPLDMGVASSPLQADSTQADTPTQEIVTSSQSTPPPKKNKVNVATQCDPEEVIVLSDSD
ncbi:death domain-associated protein 6 [Chanos chanos]|uniref:Death domain-associated protein 6 n=1 Tax=Chanos chanos TaxID=29144 RepID=A0A6J2VL43_CHACN|nr:death domain-associated protein 6 [Chanos chanos]